FGARLPAEASAQAGSAPSVPFKIGSDFVKQTHHLIIFNFRISNVQIPISSRILDKVGTILKF
ncbi:hypothetical protein COZ84_01450, partial [Candidatus Kuenenbacteria bacterium CG_4_8_14_3_um_filter_39_15]